MRWVPIVAVFALAACATPLPEKTAPPPSPLRMVSSVQSKFFSDERPLEMEIQAPFASLFKASKRSVEGGQSAIGQVVVAGSGSATVKLETRGNSTLVDCRYPKLKLRIENDPKEIFTGLSNLRINTHCDAAENPYLPGSERGVLAEALVYDLLDVVADGRFPTWEHRLAIIKYQDTQTKVETKKYALLIEDSKSMASRYGGELYNPKKKPAAELWSLYREDEGSSAFLHLFNMMIGHTDYSAWRFPTHRHPLVHNVEIVLKDGRAVLVPYDFDRTFVANDKQGSAPSMLEFPFFNAYQDKMSEETKYFAQDLADFHRMHDPSQIQAAKELFVSRRQELLKTVVNFKLLTVKERDRIASRLKEFFEILESGTVPGLPHPLYLARAGAPGFAAPGLENPICQVDDLPPLVTVVETAGALVRVKALTYSSKSGTSCGDPAKNNQREFWISKEDLAPLQ